MGPEKMIVVPPRHYCVVENPVMRDKDEKPVFDTHGQVSTHFSVYHMIGSSVGTCKFIYRWAVTQRKTCFLNKRYWLR